MVASLARDATVGAHATSYLRLRALAAPLVLLGVALREVRWGEGDTRSPMRAALAGNLVNFVLNVVLIPGAGWGVVGAGVAALVGNATECGFLLAPVARRLRHLRWDPRPRARCGGKGRRPASSSCSRSARSCC